MHVHDGPHPCWFRRQGHFDFLGPSLQAPYFGSLAFPLPHLHLVFCSLPVVTFSEPASETFLHPLHRQSLVHGNCPATQGQRARPDRSGRQELCYAMRTHATTNCNWVNLFVFQVNCNGFRQALTGPNHRIFQEEKDRSECRGAMGCQYWDVAALFHL